MDLLNGLVLSHGAEKASTSETAKSEACKGVHGFPQSAALC